MTDANLLLGYLDAGSELAGGVALDAEAAEAAVARARRRARARPARDRARASSGSPTRRWSGRCAWSRSSAASTRARFALMPFGGAGPMHAAAIAEELGIERILCPRASGVLSALGLVASERRRDTARTVMLAGDELTAGADRGRGRGAARAARRGPRAGSDRGRLRAALPGPGLRAARSRARAPDPAELARAVRRRARATLRVPRPRGRGRAGDDPAWRWSRPAPRPRPEAAEAKARARRSPGAVRRRWLEARVLRGEPGDGRDRRGAVRVRAPEATLVLPPGWQARSDRLGTIVAERAR